MTVAVIMLYLGLGMLGGLGATAVDRVFRVTEAPLWLHVAIGAAVGALVGSYAVGLL